ncbi:MAG: hypothetical protein HKL85_09240 [Acidimicrobiaceae bacterium]|nr:hypothetical protein [Acidimicrobiaceae bacterium]
MTNTCAPTFTLARVVFTRPSMTTVEELTVYVSVALVLLWIVIDEPESAVTTPDAGVTCTAGGGGFETRVAGAVAVVVAGALATGVVAAGALASGVVLLATVALASAAVAVCGG